MEKKIIVTQKAPEPIGPYSQAIQSGNMLFVSGQIPLDPATNQIITGGIGEETDQVMQNIGAILKAAGTDFTKVLKCSIFVNNMADFGAINEIYGQYFQSDPPARETVEVSGLPKGVNVEISCIALL